MNFEHENDRFFEQYCLKLAKLLRTEQTEDFLQLYDSLPSEWNGSRNLSVHEAYLQLETAKEYIRQLQELDENEFEFAYRRGIDQNEQQQIAMSDLSAKSAVIHNDDDGEQTTTTTTNNKGLAAAATGTSRITSPLIIKRQQNIETIMANDQAYDEIHDVRSKHSSFTKMNNEDSHLFYSSKQKQSSSDIKTPFLSSVRRFQPTTTTIHSNSGNNLMQGNYYDRTCTDVDCFVPMNLSIDVEQYKKTIAPVSSTNSSSSRSDSGSRTIVQPSLPPFGDTSESIQQGIAQSAVTLLDSSISSSSFTKKPHHHQKSSMKTTNNKSHERAVFDYYPKDNDDKQRSFSASSSSSSSSSSLTNCSTSDSSSTGNKHHRQEQTGKNDFIEDLSLSTNIPYQLLVDDDDDEHSFVEQTTTTTKIDPPPPPLPSESMGLLNKNPPQTISTYGTHLQTSTTTTNVSFEPSKPVPNNGYNSHGSSTTTKSSSDNSGSVRTGSGSDIDEESDEEHHGHNHRSPMDINVKTTNVIRSIPTLQRTADSKIMLETRNNKINNDMPEIDTYQLITSRSGNEEHPFLTVPRFKATDDSNGNTKLNSGTNDHGPVHYASHWSPQVQQQPSPVLSNTLSSSSSHPHRNLHEQQQQPNNNNHSGLSRTSRQQTIRQAKKRKQQQQDIIRTESIPGHRGDLDVDDLVMFIDGDSSSSSNKQQRSLRQNSGPLRPTDTNKSNPSSTSTLTLLTDSNSNGKISSTSSRRKSRKPVKIIQQEQEEEEQSSRFNENVVQHLDEDTQSIGFIDEDDEILHSNEQQQQETSLLPDDESQSNTIDSANDSNTTNGEPSLPDLLEPVRSTSPVMVENGGDYTFLSSNLPRSNSEIISEPFVTVTHRRRSVKERRNQPLPPSRVARFSVPSISSSSSQDKRRFPPIQNGLIRPSIARNNVSQMKTFVSTPTTNKPNQVEEETTTTNSTTISSLPLVSSSNEISSISDKQQQSSPRLSSHSSSSSLSSLLKRQLQSSKLASQPAVVFLNKSADIELNGVSFGFDVDCLSPSKERLPSMADQEQRQSIVNAAEEEEEELDINTCSPPPSSEFTSQISSSESTNSYNSPQKYLRNATGRPAMQRNQRGSQFYSGSDIRPSLSHSHHQDNRRIYPQPVPPPPPPSSYIDPLFLLQYNQQRLANYSHQIAYMNLLRTTAPTQFLPAPSAPQPQYMLLPTTYTEPVDLDFDEKTIDDETIASAEQQQQQPLLIYATQTAPMFFHPHQALGQTKKPFLSNLDLEQQTSSLSGLYATTQTVYPSSTQLFYSTTTQQQPNPLHSAYFQPISSTQSPPLPLSDNLLLDNNAIEHPNDSDDDNEYDNSSILIQPTIPPSSHIMSNALQLVYSEERRHMQQAGRFNLDQLTSYLAMKWMDTIDRFEQGDTRIILAGHR